MAVDRFWLMYLCSKGWREFDNFQSELTSFYSQQRTKRQRLVTMFAHLMFHPIDLMFAFSPDCLIDLLMTTARQKNSLILTSVMRKNY